MPQVQMPDGTLVDMPDVLTPELKSRLQAKLQASKAALAAPEVNWADPTHPGVAAPSADYNDAGTRNPTPAPTGPGTSHDVGAPTPYTGGHDAGIPNEDELIKAAGEDPAKVKASSLYKPGSLAALAANKQGFGGSIHERFGHGVAEPIVGLAGIGEHLIGSPESQSLFNVVQHINQTKYNATKPEGTDVAGGLGNAVGSSLMVPGAGEGMAGALKAGAITGVLQPVMPSDGEFWGAKAKQAAGGALAGGITHGTLTAVGGLMKPALAKGADWITQHNPEAFSADLLKQASELPYEDLATIQEVAANKANPRSGAAKLLLDKMDQASGDMPRVMQSSMGLKALKAKMASDADFALRDTLAKGTQVDVKRPLKVLDDIINDAEGPNASKWEDADKQNLIPELKALRKNLAETSKTTETPIGGMVDEHGNPLTKTTTKETPNTFQAISHTRSDIGDKVSGLYKGNNANIGEKGAANLQRVKEALSDALSDAAQNSGNKALAAADTQARKGYQALVGTFKDPQIVAAMHSTNPDEVLSAFTRAGKDRAQKLFNALDPKGQAAAMYGMADSGVKAMQDANGDIRPFASAIKKQADAMGIFFKGDNADRLKGISNLITGINTVSKITGPAAGAASVSAMGPHAMLGGALGGAAVNRLGAEKYTGELMKWMLTSPSAAKFIKGMSELSPTSSTAVRFIQNNLPKVVATYKTQSEGKARFDQAMNPPEQPSPVALPEVK